MLNAVGTSKKKTSVDEYIGALPDWQARIAEALRGSIRAASPKLSEAIKWAIPLYEVNGPVWYFKAHRNHLTFGFWRGAQLMEMDNRLEASGSAMAHMKIEDGDDLRPRKITALVKAAIKLNLSLGNPTAKRAKGRRSHRSYEDP